MSCPLNYTYVYTIKNHVVVNIRLDYICYMITKLRKKENGHVTLECILFQTCFSLYMMLYSH